MPSERAIRDVTDLANADRARRRLSASFWASGFSNTSNLAEDVFRRVAVEALDELYAIKADMAEIDRIAVDDGWPLLNGRDPPARVFDIAARYREVDPLVEAFQRMPATFDAQIWADTARKTFADLGYDLVKLGKVS